ncbi:hypothetical protein SAMN02745121_05408 [Nannocystis exedens]|uniref:Uncharacterized protein n=1 Tax=Nannocystis exedens TaxID=54 RepID=A0A1I2D691_9BACT|nr:hypothetical protein [Nannocystis exedens]PCC70707.1 hypothetical protein NAEX_03771 [Nannocystis exedens]SFE76015.1 hypothetical protein SAMN02745121_05408 [Nannocystis exedens]
MARRAACLLAATVWLLGGGPASAATVVLVHAPDARWRLAELRVRDELRALGMTVTDAGARGRDDGAMATLLAEHAAAAAVQISRDHERADVTLWLVDPAATAPRRLEFAVDDSRHPGLVALRAAELVHTETRARPELEPVAVTATPAAPLVPLAPWAVAAPASATSPQPSPSASRPASSASLPLDSTSTPPTPSAPVPPPGPPPQPRPQTPAVPALAEFVDDLPPTSPVPPAAPVRHHGLLVAASLGGGPGGAGVLTGLDLAGWRELTPRLEFSGGLTALVTPGWRDDLRGSILLGLVGGRAQLGLRRQLGSRTVLRLGFGGGLALGWAVGRATSPYRSASDVRPIGMLSATLTLAVRLGPRLSAHAGAVLDLLLPPLSIRSGGVEAFRIGVPLLRGVLGLAWDWPLPRR